MIRTASSRLDFVFDKILTTFLACMSVTSGGSFTVWFDCDEMFTDHAVTVYGSLKKGLKAANIEG